MFIEDETIPHPHCLRISSFVHSQIAENSFSNETVQEWQRTRPLVKRLKTAHFGYILKNGEYLLKDEFHVDDSPL